MSLRRQTSIAQLRAPSNALSHQALCAALGMAILVTGDPAYAQDPKARAQQLFQEGVEALDKGETATGCAKLRESLELFAVSNTLFLVAECDEQEGKLATALRHLERGLPLLDATDERLPMIKERVATLAPKVPRLRVVLPEGQPGTTVFLDGLELDAKALETPLLLDSGKHVFVFRAAGRQERTHELVLGPGERTEVVATAGPIMQDKPPVETPGLIPVKIPGKTPDKTPLKANAGLRTGGFVAMGIGGAALITAGITGIVVLGRRADALKNCPEVQGVPTCGASYKEQLSSDQTLVIGNAVAWGVGIAGVVTGAVLFVASNRSGAKHSGFIPAPIVFKDGVGLGLIGEL